MLVWGVIVVLGRFLWLFGVFVAPPHIEMCVAHRFLEGAAASIEEQQTRKRAYDGQHEN